VLEIDILQGLAVATGIGLLVGVERGWRERKAGAGMRTAGIRTFTLTGMLGGIFGAIAKVLADPVGGGIVLGIGFVTFAAVFALYRLREIEHEKSFGATTVVGAMATFAAGAYALIGSQAVAAAVGVAIVIVLAVREATHDWLKRITWNELRAAIVLAAMTFLALPVIPDESYGPFGGINFRQVWLLAVILAAVSFVGYAAVKRFGAGQGLLLASAAGGLVSSTAVTVMLGRRAAEGEANVKLLAAGSTLASGVSLLRTAALILFLNASVAMYAAGPLVVAAVAAAALAYWLGRDQLAARSKAALVLRNPFSLREVLALAALLAIVKFLTAAAAEYFGLAGALIAAVIAGLADTDSVTYSMAELGRDALRPETAALGALVAVASNTAFKLASGAALGGRAFGLSLATGLVIPILAGAVAAFVFIG
jgi:uncharacterized membrane protein (DUF4010 family)